MIALRRAALDGKDGTAESLAFHRAVLDASGNPYCAGFINWIGMKAWAIAPENSLTADEQLMLEIHKEHELIVAAIGKKDPELARKACRYHVILAAKRQQVNIDWPVEAT